MYIGRAGYRELNFSGGAQITWFGRGRAMDIAQREPTNDSGDKENATVMGWEHFSGYVRLVMPQISSVKLENDFTTTLAARCVRDSGLRFAQWISFLYFGLEQTALRHFE